MDGFAEGEAYGDDGEGLPEESLIFEERVGFGVTQKGTPGLQEESAAEERPGKEPDEVKAPEEGAGEFVVVHRVTATEEAEEVLVDEVEPEEAVAVHAAGVAEASEDVPGGSDNKEKEGACEGLELTPFLVATGKGEVDDSGAEEEDQSDEALCEHG